MLNTTIMNKLQLISFLIVTFFMSACDSGNDNVSKTNVGTNDSVSQTQIEIKQSDSVQNDTSLSINPHKADTLKALNDLADAWVTIGTPSWGDDKHADNSWINPEVIVNCIDGSKVVGKSEIRDGSAVPSGQIFRSHLTFPSGISKINYDNISSVELSLICMKPDFKGDYRRDDWDARNEVVFRFKDGKTLATGYSDKAVKIIFSDNWIRWNLYLINNSSPVPRARFFDHETLVPTVN